MGALSAVYVLCTFLFMMLSRSKTDARLTEDILFHNAKLLKDIKSYEIITPYRLEGRRKRHSSTRISSGHLPEATIVFPSKKKHFHLDISLNTGLFSPQFEANHIPSNDPELAKQLPHEHCFYHGTVKGEENSDVSLSTCNGIEGIIRTEDGTFFIEPLKSKDDQVLDEHVMFDADDVSEQPATCGHSSHKRSSDKQIHYTGSHLTDLKKRVRRNALDETKYVELFIINDRAQFDKYGDQTEYRAKQLVNHLDSIYRYRKIRIALVKVETWKRENLMTVDRNASKALSNFLDYKKKNLDKHKGKHFDNVQLITGVDFDGSTVGYAPILSICGTRSAAVVQDHSSLASRTASTMAHELGHNFGMKHDLTNCECPDPDNQCIMSALLSTAATRFSTCSINYLKETVEKGYVQCLFDEPMKLHGDAICGNGFVEEGEQCDCGTQQECDHFKDKCCNATSCMLLPGAACSHGECCQNCQFKRRGTLCREEEMPDDCDLPEFCTGKHEMCPEDQHVYDGVSCHKNNGYCYGGICRNIELQCQELFGDDIKAGHQWCFDRNAKKDHPFFHCHNETNGDFPCPLEDVTCGRIHCLSNKQQPALLKGQDRYLFWASRDRKTWCIAPGLSWGDGRDPQYVEDGTKCGEGKMCMKSRCIPLAEAVPISAQIKCPFNCSGNGVCNSNGNCHCDKGFACPYCKEYGPAQGGSVDSGQGCYASKKSTSSVNVAAAVLIPLFLLLVIGIGILVFKKRRTIQDRLSHYKFVRRSTYSSSNAPPARKAAPSGLHPGLISNPSPAGQPVVQSNRTPQNRTNAPLMENKQPTPRSSPQQAPGGPLRPPKAPPQPQTGHVSVPLFPPSVDPVPQETVKPRPPPPTRPLAKSNLPRVPSAPPTAPNRPKLPPSRNPANYKSVPDIPSSADAPSTTPPVAKRPNVVPPRPKPRAPPGSHRSVPEFPDDVPVPKPRNIAPRPGHQSVPLFNLPDNPEDGGSVKPSAVRANQAKPSPPRKPRANENNDENRVDFRAGLKPVPKPWEKL